MGRIEDWQNNAFPEGGEVGRDDRSSTEKLRLSTILLHLHFSQQHYCALSPRKGLKAYVKSQELTMLISIIDARSRGRMKGDDEITGHTFHFQLSWSHVSTSSFWLLKAAVFGQ